MTEQFEIRTLKVTTLQSQIQIGVAGGGGGGGGGETTKGLMFSDLS